ncbi:hypothetical protein A8990_101239 [Paenibacillus taihuensis]|uniref:DUF2802 domain-containing protein n=1 Tax=Paenibacillus taihuensis TaxID=1156355 RepID=A0A3D9SNC6_9BACL|nr:hypothetical protein [Paenibacillus taihuensis]REE94445.1 hypothetical protein A8990_101239 [Paenibacillus taihuensis]
MEAWQTIMLVGGVAVVCAAVLPRRSSVKQQQGDQSQTVRNMETALEQFMENMEADNKEMMQLVTKSSQDAQVQASKRDERIGQLEQRCAELEKLLSEQSKQLEAAIVQVKDQAALAAAQALQQVRVESSAAEEVVEPPMRVERTPSIRERYAELFELYQNAKSIDAIAKNLGLNKGEVQLILQLSKQEEAARHE